MATCVAAKVSRRMVIHWWVLGLSSKPSWAETLRERERESGSPLPCLLELWCSFLEHSCMEIHAWSPIQKWPRSYNFCISVLDLFWVVYPLNHCSNRSSFGPLDPRIQLGPHAFLILFEGVMSSFLWLVFLSHAAAIVCLGFQKWRIFRLQQYELQFFGYSFQYPMVN